MSTATRLLRELAKAKWCRTYERRRKRRERPHERPPLPLCLGARPALPLRGDRAQLTVSPRTPEWALREIRRCHGDVEVAQVETRRWKRC